MTEDEMVGWHHQLDGHEFEYISKKEELCGNDSFTLSKYSPLNFFQLNYYA